MYAAIDHAKKGDLEFFKRAPLDILLNARDSNDDTVLSIVAYGNHVDCCREICKRCPSLLCSQHYPGGYTPFHSAAYRGYLDILKILISACNEADLENQHEIEDQGGDRADRQKTLTLRASGYNAMHYAVSGHKPESIKLLIEADPNNNLLRSGDNLNCTPLHHAVRINQLEIARLLLEADPDFPYGANSYGLTPLLIAIEQEELHNYGEMIKLILELQPTQSTALHYCVFRGYSRPIECIIQSCPESSKVTDNEGQNFFHHAVKLGNVEMVEHILRMKEITLEVLNSKDSSGRTPFEVAAESQNESMILCLHKDHRVNKKLTVTKKLNWVVEKHNIMILELFMREIYDFLMNIEEEVFLNSKNEEDETILFKAAQEGKPILCEKLCKRCPSLIYHQSRGGHTALHKAVLNGQLQAVQYLVEADPDYDYRPNKSGYTPYMLSIEEARSKENKFNSGEIRKLLFKLQPRQTMAWRWENGWTLLHDAASKGDLSCIEDIIKFCPGILDVDNNEGKNFFHIAVELGKVEVVRLVLRAEDIPSNVLYKQDYDGNTPMHIAAKTGNLSLMECFLSDLRFSNIMPHGEENGWKLPHHAASDGDLGIIKDMEDLSKIRQSMDDAIDHARKGDLEFFKDAPLVILLNARDSDGGTVLSIVVNGNHVDCCEEICKRCPSLLCSQHYQGGDTPLHNAAYSGYLDILKIVISTCDEADLENQHDIGDQGGDRADRQKVLTLRSSTSDGYNAMHKAIHGGQPESIKLLIKADPRNELLRAGDHQNNTPLHLAVGTNPNHEIVRLLFEADPDFPYGANSEGKTPLLIAIDKEELHNDGGVCLNPTLALCKKNDGEMLKLILELQPTQGKVKVNENGWTALHYCVSREYSLSIEYIIQSCPESSKVADKEGQNFFHHAVKLENVKMVEHILRMITEEVLNSTDNSGRTPFEVAVESQNESMILYLHKDHRVNKKLTVTKNLNWVVEKHNTKMMKLFMKENDDFLEKIEAEVFLNSKNEKDETILFKLATQVGTNSLCEKLCNKCPSLICHRSKDGSTALHHAARSGSPVTALIEAGFSKPRSEKFDNYMMLYVDDQGDTALHMAIQNNKFREVEELVKYWTASRYFPNKSGYTPIQLSVYLARSNGNSTSSVKIRQLLFKTHLNKTEDGRKLLHQATSEEDLSCIEDIIQFCPSCLEQLDNQGKNFLHIAAELGKNEVVRLVLRAENIIKLKSCLEQLDNAGKNFLHIAAEFGKDEVVRLVLSAKDIPSNVLYNQDKAGNTPLDIAEKTNNMPLIRCFLFDLGFIKTMPLRGENHWTLLHQAASDGDLSIINKFIKSWPKFLDDKDNEGKNFLHIAAEFEKVEVVKLVLRAKEIPHDVLNHKDNDGNTPFHIAALTGNEPLTRRFLFDRRVDKDTKNKDKQHVLSEIKFPYDKRKAGVVGIAHTVDQSDLKEQSDFDLVVGALIATVSFTAGITVPGGYISDGPNQGTAVFSKKVSFATFTISNTFALVFSLFAVFSHFCARRITDDAHIIYLFDVAKGCTLAAMYCMMAAFIAGSFAILAKSNWLAIVVCIISCLFFFFGFGPLWLIVKQSKWMIVKQSKRAAPASEHKQVSTNDEQTEAVGDVEAVGA